MTKTDQEPPVVTSETRWGGPQREAWHPESRLVGGSVCGTHTLEAPMRLLPLIGVVVVALLVVPRSTCAEGRTRDGVGIAAGNVLTVPLTPSVNHHRRTALLMRLKEIHQQLADHASLLEVGASEVPLDVEILSTKHLATYYGSIHIEGTRFKVLFDTGSCEFWIPSARCHTDRCSKHNRLPQKSGRKIASRNGMNIQYLSGKVQGDMVYETVRLGDVTVKNQVVGLARVVDIELLDDVRWDGILGMAFPNPTLSAEGITPIFDTIIKSGVLTQKHLSNQFAYYISDTRGAVTFGGADCDFIANSQSSCIDQFKFVPVTEKTYWTITIKDVKIQYPGKSPKSGFCPPSGCKAIVDTGTYLIYGPQSQVTSMLAKPLKNCHHHRAMPTFTFEFHVNSGDPAVSLTLEPRDYILKFQEGDRHDCVVGISPDKDTIWTLGQVFLRSFYTVFDRDSDRVGFARLPRTNFKSLNSRRIVKALKKRRRHEKKKRQIRKEKKLEQQSRFKEEEEHTLLREMRDGLRHVHYA